MIWDSELKEQTCPSQKDVGRRVNIPQIQIPSEDTCKDHCLCLELLYGGFGVFAYIGIGIPYRATGRKPLTIYEEVPISKVIMASSHKHAILNTPHSSNLLCV